ncbi:MAG: 3-oxosteroid 1-dehydrogenase [Myxococcota bacterium]|jgi:3-oxosteroid 1-dehydrogenase
MEHVLVEPFDETVDLLVVGSGAAALSAAIRAHDLGLKVLLVEKGEAYGGSTAMSGGVIWVGNNPLMKDVGIADSDDEVRTYLQHITAGEVDDERLDAYVTESKRVLQYLRDKTHLEVTPIESYTDYYPEAPGGKMGARSLEPVPFDASQLGDGFALMQRPAASALVMGKFMITAKAAKQFIILGPRSIFTIVWLILRYAARFLKRRKFGRDTMVTNGNALVGRLYHSVHDRDIPLWLNAPATELITVDKRVVGAVVARDGKSVRVGANRGVVMAAGGFSRNAEMRKQYMPAPASTDWTAGTEHNTGDGIKMGMELGGQTALMGEAWWTPVTQYPRTTSGWVLVVEKSLPGAIFVNGNGERFTNEAAPYVDVGVAMYQDHAITGKSVPCWMVFDGDYRHNYIAGPVGPGKVMPDKTLPRRLRKHFLKKAGSLRELAELIEIDAAGLEGTVTRYNQMAKAGVDEDFGRGQSASDQYYGDHRVTPNPCMAPLDKGPYYAIPVFPGDLGTKGGLLTDASGRVRTESGFIAGLYAAGNSSASMMGRSYPGAGGTIGPALTFGFLAAEAAAGEADS